MTKVLSKIEGRQRPIDIKTGTRGRHIFQIRNLADLRVALGKEQEEFQRKKRARAAKKSKSSPRNA